MQSLIVSIGRNIGNAPMDAQRWTDFRADVQAAVLNVGGIIVFAGHGDGQYLGNGEQSFTVILSVDGRVRPDDSVMRLLRAELRELALTNGQDAIALTLGDTNFIGQ